MIIQILRNSFFLLTGHVITKALSLLCLIFIARQLGVEQFGFYGTVMAYLTLFATFADAGMSTVTIRDVAQDRRHSKNYFSHVAVLRFIMTVGMYGGLVVIGGIWRSSQFSLAFVIVCGLFLFPEAFRKLSISMLSAYERMDLVSLLEVVTTVFRYVPFVLMLLMGKSLSSAFFLLVVSWTVNAGICLIVVYRYCLAPGTRSAASLYTPQLRKILHESYPFGILAILSVIYFKIDIFMLAQMKGSAAVGFYEGAYKFIEAAMFIPVSIMNVLLPVMSRSFSTDKHSYTQVYVHTTRILAMGILPVAILVTFFSQHIILFVLGEAYTPSTFALSILIWALFLMFVNAPVGNIIATSQSIHAFLPCAIINTLLNVVLNLILIPRYSFLGACVATVITEFAAFAIQLYFAHRIMGNAAAMLTMLAKILLVGAGAGLVLYGVTPYLALPLKVLIFLGTYGSGLLMIHVIQPEDLELLCTLQGMIATKIRRLSKP